jgi:hypothetical protein
MVGHAKKARKRRTQTLAEKGQLASLYPWQNVLDSYVFMPDDSCRVFITEQDGKWSMTANIGGKHYSGERSTLEEAYKACANLLFKHAKGYWLRMDARAVTAPWKETLPEVENVR